MGSHSGPAGRHRARSQGLQGLVALRKLTDYMHIVQGRSEDKTPT